MKNLGYFDPKAVELFQANFSESLEFSEDTESYDFARCQRPDGSFYGTSGQCRKGKESGAKEAASAKKQGAAPATREQAQAGRRAAVVTALKEAKLPTNPPAYERALNKRLKARPEHAEAASALKSADKAAVQAQRNLRRAEEPLRKKGGANATPEEKAAYKAAQQEARAANTAYEKARRAEKKLRDEEARKLNNEVRAVAARAEREARAREPVVGTEMGGKKRLGDGDISTSPRD